jgi:uncharacterized protein YyaL (SSP411 family)
MNMMRLGRISGRPELEEKAAGTFRCMWPAAIKSPSAHSMFAIGALLTLEVKEVTIEGRPGTEDTVQMIDALGRAFLPEVVVRFREADRPAEAHVCKGTTCLPPVNDPEDMLALLNARND